MKSLKFTLVAVSIAAAFTARASAEAFDIVLKIEATAPAPAITGESTVAGHEGEIDIASFKAGLFQKGVVNGGGGGGVSKSEFKPLMVYKFIDKATPQLFLACATGVHYRKATLIITAGAVNAAFAAAPDRPAGEFFKLVFEDILISSVNQDASTTDGDGNLVETVEINYSRVYWYYTAADNSVTSGGFDLKANKKLIAP